MVNYKEKLREIVNESGFLTVDCMRSVPGGRKYIYYRKIGSMGQVYVSGDTWKEIYYLMVEILYYQLKWMYESIHK